MILRIRCITGEANLVPRAICHMEAKKDPRDEVGERPQHVLDSVLIIIVILSAGRTKKA